MVWHAFGMNGEAEAGRGEGECSDREIAPAIVPRSCGVPAETWKSQNEDLDDLERQNFPPGHCPPKSRNLALGPS